MIIIYYTIISSIIILYNDHDKHNIINILYNNNADGNNNIL